MNAEVGDVALRTVADLRRRLEEHGALPAQARTILRHWLAGRDLAQPVPPRRPRRSRRLESFLPVLREELEGLVREFVDVPASDGGRRRVLRLRSGRSIECVDLPRDGLCVSTQVGCAVGCRFCRTGEEGLLQQLGALEILAQVAHVRRRRAVRRVVFMGMGEPLHNLDAVLDAITVLGDVGDVGHKNLVFSTVGSPELFAQLAGGRVRPALALSLHTLDASVRQELLPRAPKIDPLALLDGALSYAEHVGYPLMVQWTLLEGVNDGLEEARRLADRIGTSRAIVNYIPFNDVEGNGYRRPAVERCVELVRTVRARGVIATLRFSAAVEIDGGCGQLRARVESDVSTDPRVDGEAS